MQKYAIMASESYQIKVKDEDFQIEVGTKRNQFSVNGRSVDLDLKGNADKGFHLLLDQKSYKIQVVEANFDTKEFIIEINGAAYPLQASDRFDQLLKDLGMEHLKGVVVNDLKAPMPGLVLDIKVKAGDTIQKGQTLIVLEAMKMENALKAETDLVVKSICCEQGIAVEKGQVLIEFEV